MRDIGEDEEQKIGFNQAGSRGRLNGSANSLDQTFKDLRIESQDLLNLHTQLKNQLLSRPVQTTDQGEDVMIPKFILILLKDRRFRKFKKILKGLEDRVTASLSPIGSPKNQVAQTLPTAAVDTDQITPEDEPMNLDKIDTEAPQASSAML